MWITPSHWGKYNWSGFTEETRILFPGWCFQCKLLTNIQIRLRNNKPLIYPYILANQSNTTYLMCIDNVVVCLCNSKQPNLKIVSSFQIKRDHTRKKKWLWSAIIIALINYSLRHLGKLTWFVIDFIQKMELLLTALLAFHSSCKEQTNCQYMHPQWKI